MAILGRDSLQRGHFSNPTGVEGPETLGDKIDVGIGLSIVGVDDEVDGVVITSMSPALKVLGKFYFYFGKHKLIMKWILTILKFKVFCFYSIFV